MGYLDEMAKYQKTEKQKEFGADFLRRDDVEEYEFWPGDNPGHDRLGKSRKGGTSDGV